MSFIFILVPGAWHAGSCLDLLTEELQSAGFTARVTSLPTVGSTESLSRDVAHLCNDMFEPLLKAGQDIIVVLHSLAGFVGSVAIKGLGRTDRKDTSRGAIIRVIGIAAVLPVEGISVQDTMGGQLAPWGRLDEDAGLLFVDAPKNFFYHDVESLADRAIKTLQRGQSLGCFRDKAGPIGIGETAFDGRRVYSFTTQDQALSVEIQEVAVTGTRLDWIRKRIETGHAPILSKPKELAIVLIDLAKIWS